MITKKVNERISVMGGGNIQTTDEVLSRLKTNVGFIVLGRELIINCDWIEKIKNDKEDIK